MIKVFETYMFLIIIGVISILELLILQKSPDTIALVIPYGMYKLFKWMLTDD